MAVVGVAFALVAAGCEARLVAGIQVRPDGSGRITAALGLDDVALAEVGGDAGSLLAVEDLRAAGWDIAAPARDADGLTWLRVSRAFDDPDDANAVLGSLSGTEGPFTDLRLSRKRSWWTTTTRLVGSLDLSSGLRGLTDPDLDATLGTFDPGLDAGVLSARLGENDDRLRVELVADLPGRQATVTGELGRSVPIVVDGRRVNLAAPVLASVLALGLVGAATVVVHRRRRSHRIWR